MAKKCKCCAPRKIPAGEEREPDLAERETATRPAKSKNEGREDYREEAWKKCTSVYFRPGGRILRVLYVGVFLDMKNRNSRGRIWFHILPRENMGSDSPAPFFFCFPPLFYTFCFFKNVYFLRVTTHITLTTLQLYLNAKVQRYLKLTAA